MAFHHYHTHTVVHHYPRKIHVICGGAQPRRLEGIMKPSTSSIKKSASFRSRIPVRRAHVAAQQRRCKSPPRIAVCASTSAIQHKTRASRNQKDCHIDHNSIWDTGQGRRYSSSSSSYSSSDESQESEAPLQKLLRHSSSNHHMARPLMTSNDALSLDGLLDTVSSCGSFHSPPNSPLKNGRGGFRASGRQTTKESICSSSTTIHNHHVSYESLDTFPISGYQLETLKISDNSYYPNHLSGRGDGGNLAPESSKHFSNCEKQRHLSDWYYIKSSPKARQQWTEGSNTGEDYLKRFPQKSASATQFPGVVAGTETGLHSIICDNRILRDHRRYVPLAPAELNSSTSLHVQYENVDQLICEKRDIAIDLTPLNSANGEISQLNNNRDFFCNATFIQSENNLKDFHFYENLVEQKNKNTPASLLLPQSPVSISTIESNHHYTQQSNKYYPQKQTTYQSEGELSGSYVSLECPSPPGPPAKLSDPRRDPQTRLGNFLKNFYIEFALKESLIPPWAPPIAPGALCPARLELELRLYGPSHHGANDSITVDQILTTVTTKDGPQIEAPRRVLIDCPAWIPRTALAFRLLYAWAKEQPWPPSRCTPVALAIYIPLNEIKGSLSNYVSKELLPKGSANPFANGFGGFNGAWSSLGNLKGKLLFVLDGYDSIYRLQKTTSSGNSVGTSKRNRKALPQDILDLLEGRLFPDSRVVIISAAASCDELLPLVQRHIILEGLSWGRSASLLGGGQWGAPTRLLDLIQSSKYLRNAVKTPLGCLAIACIYEAMGCSVPTEEMEIIEAIVNCVCSSSRAIDIGHLPELGRLALFTLKTKRASVSSSELGMYCSSTELQSAIMNCLEKTPLFGKTAKRKGDLLYTMICPGISEFLSAVYLASLAKNRPGLLAAEIAGLSFTDGGEIDPAIIKTMQFTLRLLGNSGHILISKLSPLWLSPNSVFNLALAGNDSSVNLNALCDLLGLSKFMPVSPLELQPSWIQIRSSLHELRGWALVLKSSNCSLRNIEVHYQAEKNFALESRAVFDNFLDALAINDSVNTLRISSLIECDAKETEISYLANSLLKALLKPKLESFELILTLLEEDPPALKLQSVVNALCKTIPKIPKLNSLLLDLGLCTSQLIQICSMLESCPQISRLSLPHLRCDRGTVNSLSKLLRYRSLTSLALSSCWGARDDPPSSSGVSMGSGSGSSSTTTSGLLKQSSLTGAPSPRSFSTGLFSSLPRGVLAPSSSMGRSATLPRQPLDIPPDKRSTDSVVSKSWYPTPACDGAPHTSGSLHELFVTAREPHSRVHVLDLSKAQLSLDDSMCLGETLRLSTSLHSLKLEGTSRLSEVLPAILGASESSSIQMLSVGSPRLIFEDGAVAMGARALTNCVNLRLLSVDGWTLRLENMITLSALRYFLSFTSARELGLSNCRLHIPFCRHDSGQKVTYESRSVVVVRCAGAQIIFGDNVIVRGPQLLQYLTGFSHLRELDVSTPTRSSLTTSTSTSPLIVDDKSLVVFFQLLQSQFLALNTLKMCNWIMHLDDPVKTFKALVKVLRGSPLSHVKLDGISVVDKAKKHRIESQFIATLISGLPSLRWMGMSLLGMTESQITTIGNALVELKENEIDFRLNDSSMESARLMTQTVCLDSKFDIRVSSTFGSPPGILVHAERNTGHKSLSRRHKD